MMARAGGLKGDNSENFKSRSRLPVCGRVLCLLTGRHERKWSWGFELAADGVWDDKKKKKTIAYHEKAWGSGVVWGWDRN